MILSFGRILFSVDIDTESVHSYLRLLDVSVTKTAVMTALSEHPDSQTLLSVCDALTGFGVENIAAKVTTVQVGQIEGPFIAQMKSINGLSLAVVKQIDGDIISYLPPGQSQWVTTGIESFLREFNGIVLLGEAHDDAGQRDYATALTAESRQRKNTVIGILLMPGLVFVAILLAILEHGVTAIIPVTYTVLTLLGFGIGGLLLWYEIDRYNPVLQQVCSVGGRVNCDSVLNSKASKIFGVSWSLIGFSYFMGALFALLSRGIMNTEMFQLLSVCSLIGVGYTVFSLYYQWRVVKQWCTLCLWAQGVIVAQALIVLTDGRLFTNIADFPIAVILSLIMCFIGSFLAGLLIVLISKKAKNDGKSRRELVRLKSNPHVFRLLLEKQRPVTEPTDGLGIMLGNASGKHRIIKVCNPYCGPCSKAHPVIKEIDLSLC